MLPSPLPNWLRRRIVEVIAAYRATIRLCEERAEKLTADGRRGDEFGLVGDYRMDAKYCAGQATRAPLLLLECLTHEELTAIAKVLQAELPQDPLKPDAYERELRDLEYGPDAWREVVVEPAKLAPWAWKRPFKVPPPIPEPEDALETLRTTDIMQTLSQREAEAIILTKVCLLTAEKAAEVMRCSVDQVNMAVYRGKKRMQNRFYATVRKVTANQL